MHSERRAAVVVVGGGPAGAVTAALLSRLDIPVLLIERGRYEDKPGVDVLAPEVQLELKRLGAWDRFSLADPTPCRAIQSVWGHPEIREQHFIRNPYGSAWCVRRSWLDSLLAEHARSAGSLVVTQARPTRLGRASGEWRLDVETPSGPFTARSDFLVDASGAGASVARLLGARRMTVDRMIGLSRCFTTLSDSREPDPVLLLEAHPLGWWYSVEMHSGALFVALVTEGSAVRGNPVARERAWDRALVATSRTRLRIDGSRRAEALQARPAAVGRLDRAAGNGWLAVGDAASTCDPLSGAGVRKSLIDAERAATAIRDALRGATDALPAYAVAVARSFAGHLRKRDEYYSLERRWQDSGFWSKRSRLPQG